MVRNLAYLFTIIKYRINNFGGGPFFVFSSGPAITGDSYSTTLTAYGISVQSNALSFNNPLFFIPIDPKIYFISIKFMEYYVKRKS